MIYRLFIGFYYAAIKFASLFNLKAKKWVEGRKNVFFELESANLKKKKTLWFHAASYGEFEQGRPLMEAIREKYPDYSILLTFFSPSGYEAFKDYKGADFVCYLPYDFKKNVIRFLEVVQPANVFFIRYEFWLNYLSVLKKEKVKVYLISAVFRKNQLFFKWYGKSYRNALNSFENIFVQNNYSAKLLEDIGYKNVIVSGDTRMDRVIEVAKSAKSFPLIEKFIQNKQVIIAGSTWEKEDEIIAEYLNSTEKGVKIIVAPHEIREQKIEKLISSINKKAIRYSNADELNVLDADVLIIDSIGILSSVYRYGTIAFVGGGFTDGIHNILEPAVYGMPIIFGPNYQKFIEASDLLFLGSAFCIENYNSFKLITNELLDEKEKLASLSTISSDYVYRSAGATGKIVKMVL
ncbi:MAG: 3-deoxy-D-manno-octulosonic acid transferase [Bacteroidales bacterium]|nr:3-deoxy-D-manno-octulosonic acid transferase [Bacteroidales bacterium]